MKGFGGKNERVEVKGKHTGQAAFQGGPALLSLFRSKTDTQTAPQKNRKEKTMNLNRTALAVLLLFLLPAFPAWAGENPFWAADSRNNFRILLPGGWTVRRHLSPELALEARAQDRAAFLEVHVLREPFSTEAEAADNFEDRDDFLSLSPVEVWRGTIFTVGGEEGLLRMYSVIIDGRPAEASAACFGRDGTWFLVLALVFSDRAGIYASDLERSLRSFSLLTVPAADPADPIEGRWRWHNGRILTFGRQGRGAPSSLVISWRRTQPSPQGETGTYLLSFPGPGGGEEEAVLSPDGKKLFRVSGGERRQIAARLE
jgi:hypothetical protein